MADTEQRRLNLSAGGFDDFYREVAPRLRRALSSIGTSAADEATAVAMAYGFENWERIRVMDNPVGYLYRVGRNSVRRRRKPLRPEPESSWSMSRTDVRLRPRSEHGHNGRPAPRRNTMAKYLLLKHYRGAPASLNDIPMDRWTPDEISAHIQFMQDFATRLEGTGEFVDGQALSPEGTFVRSDGEGRPPITDGPFAETKDLIAGWMVIDVDSYERAVELAGELSAAPGAGGKPIHEWLEVRPFLTAPPTITE